MLRLTNIRIYRSALQTIIGYSYHRSSIDPCVKALDSMCFQQGKVNIDNVKFTLFIMFIYYLTASLSAVLRH